MSRELEILDKVTDVVLAYRPGSKAKKARQRKKAPRRKRVEK